MPSITVSWNEAPDNDNVLFVDIYGANGTSVAFGSCALLTSVSGRDTSWSDPAVAAGQARTYYLVFRNIVGDSSPEGPINITAGALSSAYVQNLGGAPSVQEGVHASRPAAGNPGAIYVETDTKTIWRDNGLSWDEIGSSGGAPGGTSGQIQYNNAGAFGGFTVSGDGTLNASTGALTITGIGNISSGVLGSTHGGAGAVSGLLKANGSGTVTAAVANTDYAGAISIGTSPPGSPTAGQFWFNDDDSANGGRLKIWYAGASSSAWIDAIPAIPGPQGIQGPAGPTGGTQAVDFVWGRI
jgi:hypothetical protein